MTQKKVNIEEWAVAQLQADEAHLVENQIKAKHDLNVVREVVKARQVENTKELLRLKKEGVITTHICF